MPKKAPAQPKQTEEAETKIAQEWFDGELKWFRVVFSHEKLATIGQWGWKIDTITPEQLAYIQKNQETPLFPIHFSNNDKTRFKVEGITSDVVRKHFNRLLEANTVTKEEANRLLDEHVNRGKAVEAVAAGAQEDNTSSVPAASSGSATPPLPMVAGHLSVRDQTVVFEAKSVQSSRRGSRSSVWSNDGDTSVPTRPTGQAAVELVNVLKARLVGNRALIDPSEAPKPPPKQQPERKKLDRERVQAVASALGGEVVQPQTKSLFGRMGEMVGNALGSLIPHTGAFDDPSSGSISPSASTGSLGGAAAAGGQPKPPPPPPPMPGQALASASPAAAGGQPVPQPPPAVLVSPPVASAQPAAAGGQPVSKPPPPPPPPLPPAPAGFVPPPVASAPPAAAGVGLVSAQPPPAAAGVPVLASAIDKDAEIARLRAELQQASLSNNAYAQEQIRQQARITQLEQEVNQANARVQVGDIVYGYDSDNNRFVVDQVSWDHMQNVNNGLEQSIRQLQREIRDNRKHMENWPKHVSGAIVSQSDWDTAQATIVSAGNEVNAKNLEIQRLNLQLKSAGAPAVTSVEDQRKIKELSEQLQTAQLTINRLRALPSHPSPPANTGEVADLQGQLASCKAYIATLTKERDDLTTQLAVAQSSVSPPPATWGGPVQPVRQVSTVASHTSLSRFNSTASTVLFARQDSSASQSAKVADLEATVARLQRKLDDVRAHRDELLQRCGGGITGYPAEAAAAWKRDPRNPDNQRR